MVCAGTGTVCKILTRGLPVLNPTQGTQGIPVTFVTNLFEIICLPTCMMICPLTLIIQIAAHAF
jgi:hypothetical protein